MAPYTFTCRDRDVVMTTPKFAGFSNDREALDCARALARTHDEVEVWQGLRLVERCKEARAA